MNKNIIIRPIITEKSMYDAGLGKFTFAVNRNTNKYAIAQAVQEAFQVTVEHISVSRVKGARKRAGTRRIEKQGDIWKKAIITLAKGQKIDLFDIAGGKTA